MDPDRLRGKRIVLFRTDRLGDLILSLPVVEALKARLPETRIDLVTAPATTSLAALQPNVSRVVPHLYRGPAGLAALVRTLAGAGYAMAVHLYPRPLLSLAAFLARIPLRVGTAFRAYSPLFNLRVPVHRKTMTEHEAALNLALVSFLGIRPDGKPAAGLRVPEAARQRIRGLLARELPASACRPVAVIHPGSGGSSLTWPPDHFAALGRGLAASGWSVLLTGTEADRPQVEPVHRRLGSRALNLCGRLDLPHLAALLSEAALTVSNSTGPLHLADALGGRVIGLYSRHLYDSPRRWGPWNQPENVFTPEGSACRSCTGGRCIQYNCMATIRPEDVLRMARTLAPADGGAGLSAPGGG